MSKEDILEAIAVFNNAGVRTNNVDVKRITSGLIVCRTILE